MAHLHSRTDDTTGPARPHGTPDPQAGIDSLTSDNQAKLIEPAGSRHVRADEAALRSSVRQVEAFQMRRVETFILGRPRPLTQGPGKVVR